MEAFLVREANAVGRKHFLPLVAAKDRANLRGTCRSARDFIPNSQPKLYVSRYVSKYIPRFCFLDPMTNSVTDESHGIIARGVDVVIAGKYCFAARLQNGNVVTWGARSGGGDSSDVQHLLQGVAEIIAGNQCLLRVSTMEM